LHRLGSSPLPVVAAVVAAAAAVVVDTVRADSLVGSLSRVGILWGSGDQSDNKILASL